MIKLVKFRIVGTNAEVVLIFGFKEQAEYSIDSTGTTTTTTGLVLLSTLQISSELSHVMFILYTLMVVFTLIANPRPPS